MSRVLAFLPILALATLMAIAAFVLFMNPSERPQIVSNGTPLREAPAYSLERLGGGEPVTNTTFAGRTYVINLFGSYCVPCRAEHPLLMQLKARGVTIVGIDYKDEADKAEAFLTELGNPYTEVGLDPRGRYGLELGVAGAPETFVIGPDGRIRALHRGPMTPEIFEREILPALEAR